MTSRNDYMTIRMDYMTNLIKVKPNTNYLSVKIYDYRLYKCQLSR